MNRFETISAANADQDRILLGKTISKALARVRGAVRSIEPGKIVRTDTGSGPAENDDGGIS